MMTVREVYNTYYPIVLRHIKYSINNDLDAEELASDVLLKICEKLETYESKKASMKTWVIACAKNKVIDYLRKKRLETTSIEKDLYSSGITLESTLKNNTQNPHQVLSSSEDREMIETAIFSLKKEVDIEIAVKLFLENKSYNEICEEMRMNIGTVKGSIHRIRKLLQYELKSMLV